MEDHGQNVDPPEIIHDNISRLPVKPLCRFKCVSKPWRSLISDPDFIAKYSKAVENKDVFFQRRRLVFSFSEHGEHQHGLYSLDLDQFLNYKNDKVDYGLVSAAEAIELDFVYNHRGRDGWVPIFHSCNGLLLSHVYTLETDSWRQIECLLI
ncbi:hypothetical protein M0R45_019877 [Rubus argutus]|uniref:F-box domain-containing protein n=1 Tax=Rubus argutus TaxID=59490 RepID=A0AAW1X7M7_RUBAR